MPPNGLIGDVESGIENKTKVFGPLFRWEFLRQSRRNHAHICRIIYAAALLLLLYLVLGSENQNSQHSMTLLAEKSLQGFLIIQYAAVLLFTPFFVAGAIIEDRHHGTLEMLLTSHLSEKELLQDKMNGRALQVAGVLLTGMPVVAILQLIGGVNVATLAYHSFLALCWVCIASCFAVRASLVCETVLGAIIVTLILVAVFALIGLAASIFITHSFLAFLLPSKSLIVQEGFLPVGFEIVMTGVNLVVTRLMVRRSARALANREPTIMERELSLFSRPKNMAGEISTANVPTPPPHDSEQVSEADHRRKWYSAIVPSIETDPLIWKELYFPLADKGWILAASYGLIPLFFLSAFLGGNDESPYTKHYLLFIILKILMLIVLCLVTMHAAWTFAYERKKRTLIGLLGLPYTNTELLLSKALGSCWRYRHLFFALIGYLWFEMLLTQHFTLAFLLPLFILQLAFYIWLGLWLSLLPLSDLHTRIIVGVVFFTGVVWSAFLSPASLSDSPQLAVGMNVLSPFMLWSFVDQIGGGDSDWMTFSFWMFQLLVLALASFITWRLCYLALLRKS